VKKIIVIFTSVSILGLLALAFLPSIIEKNQSRNAAKGVLENVKNQNYEEAFEHVYFFDRASDLKPEISYKDAKKEWIDRLTDLREQGIYLVDYHQLFI
jgi:hypothetical protein